MHPDAPIILTVDAGSSVIKAAAFDVSGRVVVEAAAPASLAYGPAGAVEQDMDATWAAAQHVLSRAARLCAGREILALAVTGTGDGTWLVDAAGRPVAPAWHWLDSRAAPIVERCRADGSLAAAFPHTGTGLAACNQSAQLLAMQAHCPELLARSAHAMHCKDWIYLKLTGERATDPSEACFTFGDWRTRAYSEAVLAAFGMSALRSKLPPIVDGTRQSHPLQPDAAARIGLRPNLPVVLAYVDVVCQALATGIYGVGTDAGLTVLGTAAIHIRLAEDAAAVRPSPEMTGYCMCFPAPGCTMQCQTNMAGTLNFDWLADLMADANGAAGGGTADRTATLAALDGLVDTAPPGAALFHPFISGAGERGPFTDAFARASLIGFDRSLGLAALARSVLEGMAFGARDCYRAMGGVPHEIRVTGGGARSRAFRAILAACLDRPVRTVAQTESGAAGAAMIAAVQQQLFPDMAACARAWVTPLLGQPETPDPALARFYDRLFPLYRDSYAALSELWRRLHGIRHERNDIS